MTVFRKGDLVSSGFYPQVITGHLIELKRKADGKPFLMIQILTGGRQGERTWPNDGWELGVGPCEATCEMCTRRFRHQHGEESYACASCLRDDTLEAHRRAGDPTRPATSWERKQRQRKEPATS